MDLKEKLKYYQSEKKQVVQQRENNLEEIASILDASILEKDTLPVIKIEKSIPYHYINPMITDNTFSSIYIPLLTKKQFPDPISIEEILIFDLETTGLAGGTGTYPFLIGFGIFEENFIRIYQYFLPDFGREISAYLDLRYLLKERRILLSYNGKSYDYPLLRNRLILNRVDNPFQDYAHLDLLHPARRLWKNALPSCSLDTIEERILYFSRWRDIDGALIPQAYFTFLQTGDISDIQRIVDHNQQDIVSLARLLFHMHQLENGGIDNRYPDRELISMFNIAVKISDLDKVKPIIKSLTDEEKPLPTQSLKNYSLLLKREKKWDQALEIWHNLLNKGEEILFSCEEFAKYYEHRQKNLNSALNYTKRAIDFLNIIAEVNDENDIAEIRNSFNRRLKRVQNKLNRMYMDPDY